MRWWLLFITGIVWSSGLASAPDSFDLQVCMAYADRANQLVCCDEMGIDVNSCQTVEKTETEEMATEPEDEKFFYCKTRDLDGSSEDLNRWGKGTDFKFVPGKNIWEWRSKHSVMTIDSNGGFYESSSIPSVPDRVGVCGPAIQLQFEKRLEAIKQKFGA